MPLHAGEHRPVGSHRRVPHRRVPHRCGPGQGRARLYGLAGVVVCAVVLPFAVASAGPPGDDGPAAPVSEVRLLSQGGEQEGGDGAPPEVPDTAEVPGVPGVPGAAEAAGRAQAPAAATAAVRPPLPPGAATAVRCGPELTSPEGVEAQTCVLLRGTETWARTYYRNATGAPLETVLSLMGPEGRGARMRCAVSAEDAPGTCETPREPLRGAPAEYSAVAEFANRAGYGGLLLRTGSGGAGRGPLGNSPAETGS